MIIFQDAIRSGKCDPSCETYTDICGECFPQYSSSPPTTTPRTTRSPTTRITTTPAPQCPRRCKDAIRDMLNIKIVKLPPVVIHTNTKDTVTQYTVTKDTNT